MDIRSLCAAAGVLSASLALTVSSVAAAEPKPAPTPVVKSTALAAPTTWEVADHSVLVADGGLNLVGKLKRDGSQQDHRGRSARSVRRRPQPNGHRLAFTTTKRQPRDLREHRQ